MFANEVQEWGERNLVYSKEITTAQSLTWPECLSGVFVKLWTSISRYTVHLHVADQRWWRWQILHVTCRQVTSITVRLDLCFVQWRTGGIYPFEKQDFFKRRNMQQLYVLVKNITANHQLQGVLCTLISDIKHKCFKASVWSMGEKKQLRSDTGLGESMAELFCRSQLFLRAVYSLQQNDKTLNSWPRLKTSNLDSNNVQFVFPDL